MWGCSTDTPQKRDQNLCFAFKFDSKHSARKATYVSYAVFGGVVQSLETFGKLVLWRDGRHGVDFLEHEFKQAFADIPARR